MAYYESVFIARQDVSNAQVESLTSAFTDIVVQHGGKVTKTEQWGLRTLAYRINKNRKGHYVLLNLDAPAEAVNEMERNMRLHEDVLRYMTVRVEELEEGPSAMMRREERDGDSREGRPERTIRRADGSSRPARRSESTDIEE